MLEVLEHAEHGVPTCLAAGVHRQPTGYIHQPINYDIQQVKVQPVQVGCRCLGILPDSRHQLDPCSMQQGVQARACSSGKHTPDVDILLAEESIVDQPDAL